MRARSLRARLRSGDKVIGAIVRIPGEDIVDMLGWAGFDYVMIDCEHGPADIVALRQHIAFAEAHDMAVLVRVGQDEPALVQRALDQGAQGVVIPHVDSVDDARAAVRAAHYPPRGRRGFATYPRAGGFGTVPPAEHKTRMAEDTLVIAMLESPTAVRDVASIVSVEGVDGFLVGAADLAAASVDGDPSVVESISLIHAAGREASSLRVDIVSDSPSAAIAFDTGADIVLYNLAAAMMSTFRELRLR